MPRIVSLIASATEIVDALGQLEHLVGRSHECDYPESVRSLPVCTRPRIAVDASIREIDRQVKESARTAVSIYEVFEETIERLEPTHILTQIQCQVCAVSLRDVEQAMARGMKGNPKIVSLQPDSLAEIWEDVRRVARALEIEAHGEEVVRQLRERMAALCPPAPATGPMPRVACIEWLEPLPELPGCASAGETEDEARANIREAMGLYLAPGEIDLPENAKLFEVTVG